jgi:DNA-binding NtrC family response regulator
MPARHPTDAILGSASSIIALREQVRRLASFDAPGNPHVPTVLVAGETGTGKGLLARVIHDSGPRAAAPFVDVNCAAIPEAMLEAELFGFEAGALTDAKRSKPGLFEAASGGTLFLDEVDSLSPPVQSKVLKAIEEKRVRRLGAVEARAMDVKLVAATQRDLPALVASGAFRADLYHRLAVLVLAIPPLRERPGDALLLAEHFLATYATAHGVPPKRLTDDGRAWLAQHSWSGNVRELGHLLERVMLLVSDETIGAQTLRGLALAPTSAIAAAAAPPFSTAPPRTRPRTTGAPHRAALARRRQRRARGPGSASAATRSLSHAPPRHRAVGGARGDAVQARPPRHAAPRGGRAAAEPSAWGKPVAVLASLTLPPIRRRPATSPGRRRGAGNARSLNASPASAGSSRTPRRRAVSRSSARRARSSRRRNAPRRRR